MGPERLRQQARAFIETPEWSFRMPTAEDVSEFYDSNARVLTELMGGSIHQGYWIGPDHDDPFAVAAARLTDIVVGNLGVGPGHQVLDLGCGTGRPAVQLARATGARVTGVSVSAEEVGLATALARAEGAADHVAFEHADALDLPFAADSFDAVLALETLVHIPDRADALRQVCRVLRPGGRLALTDFCFVGEALDLSAQRELAELLAVWCTAPPVRLAEYPGLARAAGLQIDKIVDITAPTSRTAEQLHDAMRGYVRRHGALPSDLDAVFSLTNDLDWAAVAAEPSTDGVIVAVAHRPSEPG